MEVRDINLKELLLSGDNVDVALFVVCSRCMGVGHYEITLKGGPYGHDQTYRENCGRCYRPKNVATGKELVKIPLSDLITAIKKL